MQIQFVLGNKIVYSSKLKMSRNELFNYNKSSSLNSQGSQGLNDNQKFKIPIQKSVGFNVDEESSFSSYSSDSYQEIDYQIEDDEDNNPFRPREDIEAEASKKSLRKYKMEIEYDSYGLSSGTRKQKKELTEDDIIKKNDQVLKRKLHAKKILEEEKRQTIEKILNEDGKKLRERQKKMNEDAIKKEQSQEENYKLSLTKIKLKHNSDGKIYLRFPQGLLLPKVLLQKNPIRLKQIIPKCEVDNCKNDKKYRDPHTKKYFCSVDCYKVLKSSIDLIKN